MKKVELVSSTLFGRRCGMTTLTGGKCRRRISDEGYSCGANHREEVNPNYSPISGSVIDLTATIDLEDALEPYVPSELIYSFDDIKKKEMVSSLLDINRILDENQIPIEPRLTSSLEGREVAEATAQAMLRMNNIGELPLSTVEIKKLHDFLNEREGKRPKSGKIGKRPIVNNPKAPEWTKSLDGRSIVLVDLDGTLFDSMSCHGIRGDHGTSQGCAHVREDTLALVFDVCKRHDAVPVVLSWRPGMYEGSKNWCDEIGLGQAAVLVPGSPDAKGLEDIPKEGGRGQTGFKKGVIASLHQLKIPVVASFEDNKDVLKTMRNFKVPELYSIPRLVDLKSHEWHLGYMGAPEPRDGLLARLRNRLPF